LPVALLASESPDTRDTGMYSDCYKLATACFNIWSSNEEPTTAQHSYAQGRASYVTCRFGQGSLNDSNSIIMNDDKRCFFFRSN
jgi:hypothetical protein